MKKEETNKKIISDETKEVVEKISEKTKEVAKEAEEKTKEVLNDVKDNTKAYSKETIKNGKIFSVLAYLFIIVLLPYFGEKENRFTQYHAKQGMNLFIIELIIMVLINIVGKFIPGFIYSILYFVFIFFAVCLSIIGIINVVKGKARELPIIGRIKFVK